MKPTKLKKERITGIIIKILISFTVVFLFVLWVLLSGFIGYDNFMSKSFNVILSILPLILILLLIWKEKYRNLKMIVIIILTILVRIGHGYYYDKLSVIIEPLNHLHVKYDLKYKDMEILETQGSTIDFITPGHSRSAKIKYNKQEIVTVYYSDGQWKDNYQEIVQFDKETTKIYKYFSTTIKKYSNDFKLLEDLQVIGDLNESGYDDYRLIIFLHSKNNDLNSKIIGELDAYVAEYDSKYLSYGLFIIKDLNLYNEMIKKEISELNTINTGTIGQTSPEEVLQTMNYQYERITFNHDGYNEDIFTNNGNSLDEEYKNPNNFENVMFYYDAGRNSLVNNNDADFGVFGINR